MTPQQAKQLVPTVNDLITKLNSLVSNLKEQLPKDKYKEFENGAKAINSDLESIKQLLSDNFDKNSVNKINEIFAKINKTIKNITDETE